MGVLGSLITLEFLTVMFGYSDLVFGYPDLVFGYLDLVFGHPDLMFGYSDLVFGYLDLVFGYSDLVFGYSDLMFGYSDLVFGYSDLVFLSSYSMRSHKGTLAYYSTRSVHYLMRSRLSMKERGNRRSLLNFPISHFLFPSAIARLVG